MHGSHDMRHTGFRRLTVVIETPGFWGVKPVPLMDGIVLSQNPGILAYEVNSASYVQVGGNGSMSSALSSEKP